MENIPFYGKYTLFMENIRILWKMYDFYGKYTVLWKSYVFVENVRVFLNIQFLWNTGFYGKHIVFMCTISIVSEIILRGQIPPGQRHVETPLRPLSSLRRRLRSSLPTPNPYTLSKIFFRSSVRARTRGFVTRISSIVSKCLLDGYRLDARVMRIVLSENQDEKPFSALGPVLRIKKNNDRHQV